MFRHTGAVDDDCEVDSVWHKYDVRRAADNAKGTVQKQRNTFVTQRRRQLRSTMWTWPWQ